MGFSTEIAVFFLLVSTFSFSVAIECWRCASTNDVDGSPNTENCITAFDDQKDKVSCPSDSHCYIFNDKKIIRRGCIKRDDQYVTDKNFCDNNRDTCISCDGQALCNGKKLEIEECFQDSYDISVVPSGHETSPIIKCPIDSFKPLGCYHSEKNNIIKKGCVSALKDQDRKDCEDKKDCEICRNKVCNAKVVRKRFCIHCNETVDVNCAEPGDSRKSTDCSYKSSFCILGIDSNGLTHRNCGKNQTNISNDYPKGFEMCHSDLCNNKTFPDNRLKYYQCQGDTDCNFQTSSSKQKLHAKVCEIYSDKDECYTYTEQDKKVFRGCMSDKNPSRTLCEKNESRCTKCKTEACNDAPSAGNLNSIVSNKVLVSVILATSIFIHLTK